MNSRLRTHSVKSNFMEIPSLLSDKPFKTGNTKSHCMESIGNYSLCGKSGRSKKRIEGQTSLNSVEESAIKRSIRILSDGCQLKRAPAKRFLAGMTFLWGICQKAKINRASQSNCQSNCVLESSTNPVPVGR